jgi:NAD(P)-dependent dehydrogenase (short-subunit alcohol dehydrogenase family)
VSVNSSPHGTRISTGFGEASTAGDVIAGVDLNGKRAVITGASSGIGVETARALAGAGAEVTLAVRDVDAGGRVAAALTATNGRPVHVARLDLDDLASVAEFLAGWTGALHILINNAGVMAVRQRELTAAGWEMQFGTNHIGHFALAAGLHPHLAAAGGARIVSLSSNGHMLSPVVFDDINYDRRAYDQWTAYGQSKTANALFAVGATHHWVEDGITTNSVHPGAIPRTNLLRHADPTKRPRMGSASALSSSASASRWFLKSVEQGAATTVLVATSPLLTGVSGRYFEDCNESTPVTLVEGKRSPMHGVARHALDPEAADRLWEISEKATAVTASPQ